MDKWEYANIRVSVDLTGVQTEASFYHSDKKHEVKEGEFGKLLALMGDEGWEMVASNARTEGGPGKGQIINYMFKRKKA